MIFPFIDVFAISPGIFSGLTTSFPLLFNTADAFVSLLFCLLIYSKLVFSETGLLFFIGCSAAISFSSPGTLLLFREVTGIIFFLFFSGVGCVDTIFSVGIFSEGAGILTAGVIMFLLPVCFLPRVCIPIYEVELSAGLSFFKIDIPVNKPNNKIAAAAAILQKRMEMMWAFS